MKALEDFVYLEVTGGRLAEAAPSDPDSHYEYLSGDITALMDNGEYDQGPQKVGSWSTERVRYYQSGLEPIWPANDLFDGDDLACEVFAQLCDFSSVATSNNGVIKPELCENLGEIGILDHCLIIEDISIDPAYADQARVLAQTAVHMILRTLGNDGDTITAIRGQSILEKDGENISDVLGEMGFFKVADSNIWVRSGAFPIPLLDDVRGVGVAG